MGDSRWFRRVASEFCPLVLEYAGRPIHYVEIGCWEGASAAWVAEHVLTHPDSFGWGIDPYAAMLPRHTQQDMDVKCQVAAQRLAPHGNWSWVRLPSMQALLGWQHDIDVLYIDGQHEAPYVLMDFVLAWPHLREGGLVIFDDYAIGSRKSFPCVPDAVHAIATTFAGLIEHEGDIGRQAAFRVVKKNVDAAWFRATRATREAVAV